MRKTELTGLAEAVAAVDAADAACPVRNGKARHSDECPKCRATTSHPCGPVVNAEFKVVEQARSLLRARALSEAPDA